MMLLTIRTYVMLFKATRQLHYLAKAKQLAKTLNETCQEKTKIIELKRVA